MGANAPWWWNVREQDFRFTLTFEVIATNLEEAREEVIRRLNAGGEEDVRDCIALDNDNENE
jgi:hypothetical protein